MPDKPMTELKITKWTLSEMEETCALWRARVAELEAAEKEAETIDEPPTEPESQAAIDAIRLNLLESRLADLARQHEGHHHDGWRNGPAVGSTTGPRYG